MASSVPRPRRSSFGRFLLIALVVLALLVAAYFAVVLNWSYSSGERAGWVQKFSRKGWFCKTWEGEIALVSMPGAIPEKFTFTVLDDAVAEEINRYMGRRVALHYEEKVGLPTSCFGDTRYYVTRVISVSDAPPAPLGSPPITPAPGTPGSPGTPGGPPIVPPATVPGAPDASAPATPSAPTGGSAPGAPTGPVPGLPSIPAPVPDAPAVPGATPSRP